MSKLFSTSVNHSCVMITATGLTHWLKSNEHMYRFLILKMCFIGSFFGALNSQKILTNAAMTVSNVSDPPTNGLTGCKCV